MQNIPAMRPILACLLLFAFAVASLAAAGVAPMGTAAHQHAMQPHHDPDHRGHGALADAECPAPLIACSAIGAAPEQILVAARIARFGQRAREAKALVSTHEPVLSLPPPKA
jgi:hypothetical protein